MKNFWAFILVLVFAWTLQAGENPLKNLGTFGVWTAYVYQGVDGKVCYMASEPETSVGKYKKRDDVFLMVTHRPKQKTYDVVNTVAGYTYQKGSKPSLSIDKKKAIVLSAHEDTAWAKDGKTDQQLVSQMKAGSNAVLNGVSKRGTQTTDTFSLKGFSKAYDTISKACGK